jgi:carbon-monoxide dehydrogenase medium subunit
LKGVSIGGEDVTIGAMTTYNELRDTPGIGELFPAITQVIQVIGDPQVRANGTIGGALAHNDPAADFTAVFLALGGRVVVKGPNGERSIAAADLFVDLWTTSLEPDEIITSVILPKTAAGATSSYQKHAHPASGYAVVGVAVAADAAGVSVVVTGATSIPTHLQATEAALAGGSRSAEDLKAAAAVASEGLELNSSPYASEAYLKQLITVLTGRGLTAALGA